MAAIIFKVPGEGGYRTPIIVTDRPPTAVGQFVRIDGQLFSVGGIEHCAGGKVEIKGPKTEPYQTYLDLVVLYPGPRLPDKWDGPVAFTWPAKGKE